MSDKTKNTLIISLLSAGFLGLLMGFLYFNKQNQDILSQTRNIHPDSKLEFVKEVTPSEVDGVKNELSKDLDLMINGESNDKFGTDEGASYLRKLFIVTGKPPVDEKDSKNQRADYYKPFTYQFSNFGVHATGKKSYEIITDMEVKYGGKQVYGRTLSFDLNSEGKITGGEFYAKS